MATKSGDVAVLDNITLPAAQADPALPSLIAFSSTASASESSAPAVSGAVSEAAGFVSAGTDNNHAAALIQATGEWQRWCDTFNEEASAVTSTCGSGAGTLEFVWEGTVSSYGCLLQRCMADPVLLLCVYRQALGSATRLFRGPVPLPPRAECVRQMLCTRSPNTSW